MMKAGLKKTMELPTKFARSLDTTDGEMLRFGTM